MCIGVNNNEDKKSFLRQRHIYKYMNMENALNSLQDNYLYFQVPSEWEDRFEKWLYEADYSQLPNGSTFSPKIYACCFTLSKECEAAWNTYTYGNKTGLASRGVQFVLHRKKLRKCFEKYASSQASTTFYEGKVNYKYSRFLIENMHKPSTNETINTLHNLYFNNFYKSKYLFALLLKRPAFEYENEIRFLLEDMTDCKKDANRSKIVQINWSDIIVRIIIDESCTDLEQTIFREQCNRICKSKGWNLFEITKGDIHAKQLTPAKIHP